MTPLPFVWPDAVAFWIVYAWAFCPEYKIVRSAQRSLGCRDAKSLQVLVFGHGAALVASFPLAWIPIFQITEFRTGAYLVGIAVLIAGSLLRRHCWRMLGASFTGDVRATAGQKVITRGAYYFICHPSYTGGILLYTGVGIALGSWASIGLLAAATLTAYIYRIAVEERELLAVIGEPYRLFISTRKRLIPFIY